MASAMVANPADVVAPHKAHLSSSIPTVESLEGFATEGSDDYSTFKKLQRQLEYIQLQEEYIKDEQRYVCLRSQLWLDHIWRRRTD
jgi:26S proteasome regulatory subunit T3